MKAVAVFGLLRNAQDAWEQWAETESKLLFAILMAIYDNLDGLVKNLQSVFLLPRTLIPELTAP